MSIRENGALRDAEGCLQPRSGTMWLAPKCRAAYPWSMHISMNFMAGS